MFSSGDKGVGDGDPGLCLFVLCGALFILSKILLHRFALPTMAQISRSLFRYSLLHVRCAFILQIHSVH